MSPWNAPKLLVALHLLIVALACPAEAQMGSIAGLSPTPPTSGPVTVSGVVVNATNGTPISRALVRINDRAMLTDHEGKFEFAQFTPPSSSVVLNVQKPGFYFGQEMGFSPMVLRAEQITQPIVARLYPEALITGTLTTQDGTPLPQVFVRAVRSSYNDSGHQWLPVKNSITNSHGEFRLAVPPGDYRITSTPTGRLRGGSQMTLPVVYPSPGAETTDSLHMASGTEQHLELHVAVSQTHAVKILLDSSSERSFPTLMVRSSDGAVFPASVVRSGTPDGMQIALPSGTFTLLATLNREGIIEYGETTVTVGEQNLSEVVLHLAPVAPIPVQVVVDSEVTSDKTPPTPQQLGLWMQNIQETVFPLGTMSSMPINGTQGATFRLTPGTYRFSARYSGQWYVKSVNCGTANLLQQDLAVTAGGAGSTPIVVTVSDQTGGLQGFVKQKGAPISGWVYAVPSGQSAVAVYSAHSGTDGSFNLASLPPGNYEVIAFENRHSVNYRDPNALAAFNTYIQNAAITHGNKATVNLESVPEAELHP